MEIIKQDWCLFRNKIAAWQEAYMEQLNQGYMDILSGQGNPSEKFWLLEKANQPRQKTPWCCDPDEKAEFAF